MLVPKATASSSSDPKSSLTQVCQRLSHRPVTKADIEYSTQQYGSEYQATVKLNCFNGEAYAGQLAPTPKEAERSAAQHALADFDPSYKIQPMTGQKGGAPAAAAMHSAPAAPKNEDPKSQLNEFLQRHLKRPIAKPDIVYTTMQFDKQYQASVTLACLNNEEYAGHLSSSTKEAEKSAAQQALTAHASDIAALPTKPAKRKAAAAANVMGAAPKKAKLGGMEEPGNAAVTPKTLLNSFAMKHAKRALTKGETVYECTQVEGGYQATVALSALPGEYASVVWAGNVCPSKQLAEQSAAEIALAQLTADPALAAAVPPPKAPKGQGKGKGFGKGFDGKGKGKGGFGDGWGGKGKGKFMPAGSGGGTGDQGPRKRISETVFSGECLVWMGTYGWIKPQSPIDHPAAKQREGKVYVNKRDVASGEMKKGAIVSFKVFEDPSGLGAEEVSAA